MSEEETTNSSGPRSSFLTHHSSLITLLAEVRWQAFRNSLRSRRKKFELAAQILKGCIGAAIVLAVGAKVGFQAYAFFEKGKSGLVPGLLEVFAVWQLGPLIVEAASPALNFRQISRFPISFRRYCLLNTAYGLLDPAAVASLVWLACVWGGIWAARPEAAGPAAVLFAVFALVNLLFNRVLFGYFERLLSTRRGRERFAVVILVFVLFVQVCALGLVRLRKAQLQELGLALAQVHRFLPTGLVSDGVQAGWPEIALLFLLLAAYAGATAFFLRRQLWRNYQGEVDSEAVVARGAVQVQPGWKLPLLSDATSAMLEKELRYALRDPRTLLAFLVGPLLAGMGVFSSEIMARMLTQLRFRTELLYVGLAGYVVMSLGTLAYNCFCYDARGFDRWLLAPLRPERIFLAKNAALGLLLAADFGIVTLLLLAGPGISLRAFLMVAAGFVYASLALLGAGNLISAWYPMGRAYGELSTKKVSHVAVFVIVVGQMALLGSLWMMFQLATWWDMPWLPLPGFLALILGSLCFYLFSLDAASKYVWEHSEEIAAELV